MIVVDSFLKVGDGFVPIADHQGRIDDPYYIEGAIELVVDGVAVLGLPEWDLVDQLWHYIVDCLEQLNVSEAAETTFPDQPIWLRFRRVGAGWVRVSLAVPGDTTVDATAKVDEFFTAMIAGAERFFEALARIEPANRSSHQGLLARLSTLRSLREAAG